MTDPGNVRVSDSSTTTDSTALRKNMNRVIVLLCLVFLIAGYLALNELNIYTPDSTRYLVWANSIAQGDGFLDQTAPEPERYVIHAPFYAVVLAPIARFIPFDIISLKIVTLMFGVLTIVLFYQWLSRILDSASAFLGSVLLAASPLFLQYSTEILSDVPFAACLMLVFLLFERMPREGQPPVWSVFAIGALIAAGILLREVGTSLLLGALLYFVLQRDFKNALVVLLVTLIPYGLWLYRNEVIVAGIEHPALTNSKLFFQHSYSLPNDSLLTEFFARAMSNTMVYAKLLGGLVFFPTYISTPSLLVSKFDPSVLLIQQVMNYAGYLVGSAFLLLAAWGLYADVRNGGLAKLRSSFLGCYLLIILLYPINDRRFLVPIMLLAIFYMLLGGKEALRWLTDRGRNIPHMWAAIAAMVAVLLIPNIVWSGRYISNSLAYQHSARVFVDSQKESVDYPWHFTKLFRDVGVWVQAHSDTSEVFLAQWKDLSVWLNGRKLQLADQTIAPDDFDHLIRDYRVQYVIAMVNKNESREFEFQMQTSRKYQFKLVERAGNTEIYAVRTAKEKSKGVGNNSRFGLGLTLLARGEYQKADSLFTEAISAFPGSMNARFYLAVSRELAGDWRAADSLFTSLRSFGQAGMYVDLASSHQRLMSNLQRAERERDPQARAGMLLNVASSYWSMGFRNESRKLIERASAIDTASAIALFFGFHFALEEGDTAAAAHYLGIISSRMPDHQSGPILLDIFDESQRLSLTMNPTERSDHLFKLGLAYHTLGIVDVAIDRALIALEEDPGNLDAALLLGKMYRSKRRFLPSARAYRQALLIDPVNVEAKEGLASVAYSDQK